MGTGDKKGASVSKRRDSKGVCSTTCLSLVALGKVTIPGMEI